MFLKKFNLQVEDFKQKLQVVLQFMSGGEWQKYTHALRTKDQGTLGIWPLTNILVIGNFIMHY